MRFPALGLGIRVEADGSFRSHLESLTKQFIDGAVALTGVSERILLRCRHPKPQTSVSAWLFSVGRYNLTWSSWGPRRALGDRVMSDAATEAEVWRCRLIPQLDSVGSEVRYPLFSTRLE